MTVKLFAWVLISATANHDTGSLEQGVARGYGVFVTAAECWTTAGEVKGLARCYPIAEAAKLFPNVSWL
jgi:hypothetical protein